MKNKTLKIVLVMIPALILGIFMEYESFKVVSGVAKMITPAFDTKSSDPITIAVLSISHKQKLVVTDVNIRAETKSQLASDVWDAAVTSYTTGRVQIWFDLSKFNQSMIIRDGKHITIHIPHSAIDGEVIVTEEKHTPNGSWLFSMRPSEAIKLEDVNHTQLTKQLSDDKSNYITDGHALVESRIKDIFETILNDPSYTVVVNQQD